VSDSRQAPKVSIVTLSYNQERYIREALDSVLMQECDFKFECIVGDDRSSDSTPEILREYQARHPDRIHPVIREENLGPRRNLADILSRCTGQYVAILDGDDYWTSPHKLQTQVAFMDAHPDCALSFHDVRAITEDGQPYDLEICTPRPERTEIEDLLKENYISTCTVMYRWGLVEKLPEWWDKTWVSDYSLHVLHAAHGWIGYIDEEMAAYRIHGDGLWSGQRAADRMDEFVKTLGFIDKELGLRYHEVIQRAIYNHVYCEFEQRFDAANKLHFKGERAQAWPHVRWLLLHLNRRGHTPLNAVIVLLVRSTMPWLIDPLVAAKRFLLRGRSRGDAS